MHSRETPSTRAPTFEDIAVENRKRLALMGVMPNNRAIVHSLMQMMSCTGELCNLAYHNETSLSPFEHSEVRAVIGKMAVCLATIGDVFDVNVGQEAMETIAEQLKKTKDATPVRGRSEQKVSAPILIAKSNAASAGGSENNEEPNVLLSPTSNRDFFGYLDELVKYSPSDFEKADLKWVAPLPDGTIQDLIENGSTINVKYKDLPKYLDCVRRYRNARTNDPLKGKRGANPSSSVSAPRPKSATFPVTKGGNPVRDKEESPFSPTNLEGGLLSPNVNAFAVAMDASMPKVNTGNTSSSEVGTSEAEFYTRVEAVKQGHVMGAQVAQLNLTFSVPRNGKLVELIPNGIHVKVTSANVAEFLRLLEDKSAMMNGRVRRLESIKKLEVTGAGPQDLSRDKDKFSPTHFSKDIFAPYEERTSFLVDCDASDEILPVFIKEREQQQRRTESKYVSVVCQGDTKSWKAIIDELQRDPSALKKYGVTFCVPSAVVLDATEEEQATKVHELTKGGITTPVEESQLWLFYRMIEQYYCPSV
ncbi:hypothetical protein DQ04_01611040 [Trypanosoma grayi]|uniref:hypothetical protein n=1 Tax=Trypanosoma grayi TaxID=71804 RepID=UPI0004F3F316|nr:hypothetical protein DQ04_01611040 [Trypanosoma grayi]KEG12562.1 hypothetical protein DQ04_01611040 [Trypanosoma grayi]